MPKYPQRTDLAIATPKSKTYGDAADSRRRQQAVPMGVAAVPQMAAATPSAGPRPQLIPLDAPSQRPDEPITAGADFGPGPNSVDVGLPPPVGGKDDLSLRLRAIASQFPTAALLGLITELENNEPR